MSKLHSYWVYMMASRSGVLYVGMTNDLERRVLEHKQKLVEGFTKKYNCTKLVWCEEFREVRDAIECETRMKDWRREKKAALIQKTNPGWKDLSGDWFEHSSAETTEIPHPEANDGLRVRNDSRPREMSFRAKRGISVVNATKQ
jgi:putative endonuclease